MQNKTSIIIVTYNGMTWLKKCLDSCKDNTVIVVDNNSTDNTVKFIEGNYPNIKLFKQVNNLGFGQGNNLGISYALSQGAEHVFLLNQDAYIIDDCLEQLVSTQIKKPEYGVLSPIHITASRDKLDKNFAEYVTYDNNNSFYSDFVLSQNLKSVYSVPFVNAAAWLLSKKMLLEIGGFDPLFFHYGEDNNFCQRVLFHNYNIGVVSNALIIHDRENRKVKTNLNPKEALRKKELILKAKWANINTNEHNNIKKYKKKLRIKTVKSIFKLKFSQAIIYNNELKLIRKIEPEILFSKTVNFEKGTHYLSIN